MEKKERESAFIKMVLPLLVVLAAIYIAKSGYMAGGWLYKVIHS